MEKYTFLLLISFSIFITSCTDNIEDENGKKNSSPIQCSVRVLEKETTRGIPIFNANDTALQTIGLFGYHTEKLFDPTINPAPTFFDNALISKVNGNKWSFGKNYYWPQTGYISFFAYSPMATAHNGLVVEPNQSGYPQLTYTLPTDVVNQPDLMIATPQMNLFKTEVNLELSHALSCISFDVSGENVPIEYIGVKGVYTTGQLSLNLVDKLPDWTSLSNLSNTLYKVGLKKDAQATNPADTVMATNGYLMMIPQKLNENAAIVIKFQGIDEKTIYFKNINTSEWKAGYKYNYMLKEGIYNFTVTPNTYTCPYSGGDLHLDFTSTYTSADNKVVDLGWTVDMVDATPNNNYWKDLFSHLASDDGTLKSKSISILPSQFTTTSPIDLNLQKADSVKYNDIKDLSFNGSTYNTSNTYVVNSSGWFKIPCTVMGNGIKNGTEITTANNDTCYNKSAPYFVNYLGQSITSTNDLLLNTLGATVEVLWSDAPNLISNVHLSDNNQYIEFYVNPNSIRQGNTVLAIKQGNQIMWSWQIWVTDWILNTNSQVLGQGNPNLMPFSVGRCSAALYQYAERSVTLRFTQKNSGLVQEVTITQQPQNMQYGENAVYYQWGRKDPVVATDGLSANNKATFGNHPFVLSANTNPVTINQGILNPNIFYQTTGKPGNWDISNNIYLWGCMSGSYTLNVKTIYDPCPQGYQMMTLDVVFQFLSMPYKFVTDPIVGCQFSANNNNDYNIFLASNGSRFSDSSIIGLNITPRMGNYWSNRNFYWSTDAVNQQMFLNLIFPSSGSNVIYYQSNSGASALNVCGLQVQ